MQDKPEYRPVKFRDSNNVCIVFRHNILQMLFLEAGILPYSLIKFERKADDHSSCVYNI